VNSLTVPWPRAYVDRSKTGPTTPEASRRSLDLRPPIAMGFRVRPSKQLSSSIAARKTGFTVHEAKKIVHHTASTTTSPTPKPIHKEPIARSTAVSTTAYLLGPWPMPSSAQSQSEPQWCATIATSCRYLALVRPARCDRFRSQRLNLMAAAECWHQPFLASCLMPQQAWTIAAGTASMNKVPRTIACAVMNPRIGFLLPFGPFHGPQIKL